MWFVLTLPKINKNNDYSLFIFCPNFIQQAEDKSKKRAYTVSIRTVPKVLV